jgi:hypothetical protein
MSAVLQPVDPSRVLARMHAELDGLQALDLTGCSSEELEAYWREKERLARRLPSLDHALVQEVGARGLPQERGVRTAAQYVRGLLRLDPTEAHGRVKAAEAAARRRALTGELLPAKFEAVAAAQQAGSISERHARIVIDTVEHLPAVIRDSEGDELAAQLVGYARQFDPHQLARLARRMADCLNPDGTLKDSKERDRERDITLHQRADGSGTGTVKLTAELMELLLTHFDAYAQPKTSPTGEKDPRTAAQRRHDALLEALKANLRAKQLPTVAGVTATIIATMTTEQYLTGTGLARTAHGAQVPVSDVFTWAGGDYRLFLTVLDTVQGVTHYSSTRRLFSENQRLVRHAIDGGCTFPNCPMPALWCELDHSTDHTDGGISCVTNADLACDYHNRIAKTQGWQPSHINGRVAWTPPHWIDPHQTPRYNYLHNTDPPP